MNRLVPRKLIAGGAALALALLTGFLLTDSQASPTLAIHTGGMDAVPIDMGRGLLDAPTDASPATATGAGSETNFALIAPAPVALIAILMGGGFVLVRRPIR